MTKKYSKVHNIIYFFSSNIACEYIEAALGNGKEYFGFKTALHATSPSVWLPFNLFDQLLLELKEHSDQPIYKKVCYLINVALYLLSDRRTYEKKFFCAAPEIFTSLTFDIWSSK